MIPITMILSLDQGPKWQARWDEGKAQGGSAPQPAAAPARHPAPRLLDLLPGFRLVPRFGSAAGGTR